MPEEEMVTITKAEYQNLLNDERLLVALFQAGVDNWEGYEIAQESLSG